MFGQSWLSYGCMGKETLIDTFRLVRHKLHCVAGRLLNDEMEAEDAVQDTFCNLWSAGMPDTSAEARHRLFAVLRNVCLNKLKRKRNVVGIEAIEIAVEDAPGHDAERLRKAIIDSLTPLQREIFSLSVNQELEYQEIAERLGISIDAVRMHMMRVRKAVRYKIKDYGYEIR